MPRPAAREPDQEWGTPRDLVDALARRWAGGRFDLDVAASAALHVCGLYFTAANDGLRQPWFGVCFLNPPYGAAEVEWIAKARAEVLAGRARRVVALLPAKTGNSWWRRFVVDTVAVPPGMLRLRPPLRCVDFLPNKLRFLRPNGAPLDKARFHSVVLVFDDCAITSVEAVTGQ